MESLRCLHAFDTSAVGHLFNIIALPHDERIGRRNGDIDGALRFQRVANIVDDALTDEWAHSVVEDEVSRFGLIETKGVNR